MNKPKCLSIFSGGGGLDLGFEHAGFEIVGATDLDAECANTFLLNRPEIPFKIGKSADFSREFFDYIDSSQLEDLDCLIGGPPCPGFSKSRFYRKDKQRGLDDANTDETINAYLRVLTVFKPKFFVLENVKGLTYKPHKESLSHITDEITRLGYKYNIWNVNAADYGVPQIRERVFIVGALNKVPSLPLQTHLNTSKNSSLLHHLPWVTAGEVLSDLPSNGIEEIKGHFAGGKHNELLKLVPKGDNYLFFTEKRGHPDPIFQWRSRYWSFLLKLSPDMPSWTIQAKRSNNMGPFHWNNRILTIEEIKRLQTFPDSWQLAGNVEAQWRQIGNAVPCRLAKVVGRAIMTEISQLGHIAPDGKNSEVSAVHK